jgi:hypothetical protein
MIALNSGQRGEAARAIARDIRSVTLAVTEYRA